MQITNRTPVLLAIWKQLDPQTKWALIGLGMRKNFGEVDARTFVAVRSAARYRAATAQRLDSRSSLQ
jgi:hypothetical protein